MYSIKFYKDKFGIEPLKDYFQELGNKKDKHSRININKIRDYLKALSEYGTSLGEPYIKHLSGEIWELRPIRNRILFFAYDAVNLFCYLTILRRLRKLQ